MIKIITVKQSGFSEKAEKVSKKVNRRAVTFPSEGETLRGWLYFPSDLKLGWKLPAIVTANALSGIKRDQPARVR